MASTSLSLGKHSKLFIKKEISSGRYASASEVILDQALADHLRRAVGFRNIVVHNYEAVNWDIVFHLCKQRLDDFRAFAKAFSDEMP